MHYLEDTSPASLILILCKLKTTDSKAKPFSSMDTLAMPCSVGTSLTYSALVEKPVFPPLAIHSNVPELQMHLWTNRNIGLVHSLGLKLTFWSHVHFISVRGSPFYSLKISPYHLWNGEMVWVSKLCFNDHVFYLPTCTWPSSPSSLQHGQWPCRIWDQVMLLLDLGAVMAPSLQGPYRLPCSPAVLGPHTLTSLLPSCTGLFSVLQTHEDALPQDLGTGHSLYLDYSALGHPRGWPLTSFRSWPRHHRPRRPPLAAHLEFHFSQPTLLIPLSFSFRFLHTDHFPTICILSWFIARVSCHPHRMHVSSPRAGIFVLFTAISSVPTTCT